MVRVPWLIIMGLTPQDQRQKNKDAFQNDSKVRFSRWNPCKQGDMALTLTAANTVIYYSNGYDLEKTNSVRGPCTPNRSKESP